MSWLLVADSVLRLVLRPELVNNISSTPGSDTEHKYSAQTHGQILMQRENWFCLAQKNLMGTERSLPRNVLFSR